MEKIATEIDIAAPAAKVYEALTTGAGHRGWWTTDCEVGSKPGEQAAFRFDPMGGGTGTTEMRFRIDKLEPGRAVEWTCVAQANNPDWQDTTLSFRLSPSGSGTRVALTHDRWRSKSGVYDACVAGWSHFMQSLKKYAETGQGTPHVRKQ